VKYLAFIFLAILPIGCSEFTDPGNAKAPTVVQEWVYGKWQYDDHDGKSVVVTIYPDGSVLGNNILSQDDAIGSWFFIDGTLHIVWMSGWTDLIEKKDGYTKLGFAPGVATSDVPTNRSKAVKVP
jgi:hypothetical protein